MLTTVELMCIYTERHHVMAMNLLHRRRCSSAGWAEMVQDQLLLWALGDVQLGERTLEIGPGYGATLRVLVERAAAVTAVEVDKPMATGSIGSTAIEHT